MRTLLFFLSASCALAAAAAQPINVARGKPVTFTHKPNYLYCADPDDAKQLTDGHYVTEGTFWTAKGCVGWNVGAKEVKGVTVDLGADTPITGFSWNFAFGRAGVKFPESVDVYVSADGKAWNFAGALLDRSLTLRGMPPPDQYAIYRAHAEDMPCHGRYVMFLAVQPPYCFVDEIEVYRGDDALLKTPNPGGSTDNPIAFHKTIRLRNHLIDQARLAQAPQALLDRIDREVDFADYRDKPTILPMSDLQRDLWAANATRLRKNGFTRPVFWTSCRWKNLNPLETPPAASVNGNPLRLDMMRGEIRAETVNVLNPTDKALDCDFSVTGLDDQTPLDCREVLFTDTKLFRITASALKPGEGRRIRFSVPAGASKQIWISVRKPTGPAGLRKGTLVASLSNGIRLEKPLELRIRNLDFPERPHLHVGGWDYIDGDGVYYKAPGNLKSTIALHRDIGLDVPWGSSGTAPGGGTFDAEGNLVSDLDFRRWDHWTTDLRPDARIYAVFLSVSDAFHGEPAGTPRFERMVVSYLTAWAKHARANGLNGRRILLLLVDEPSSKEKQDIIFRWMKPIRAAKLPEFRSFEDPQFSEPWNIPEDFWDLCDVICPITCQARNERILGFWTDLAAKGKEIWLYSAHGPSRTFDPISYYRMQAWTAFRIGSRESASQFWAFGCGGGQGDSWKAYAQPGVEYSPYFVSPTDVMTAKQNEAVREGVEDYEYLRMFAARFGREKLAGVFRKVFGALPYDDPDWDAPGRDHALLDRIRVRLLDRLEAAAK